MLSCLNTSGKGCRMLWLKIYRHSCRSSSAPAEPHHRIGRCSLNTFSASSRSSLTAGSVWKWCFGLICVWVGSHWCCFDVCFDDWLKHEHMFASPSVPICVANNLILIWVIWCVLFVSGCYLISNFNQLYFSSPHSLEHTLITNHFSHFTCCKLFPLKKDVFALTFPSPWTAELCHYPQPTPTTSRGALDCCSLPLSFSSSWERGLG